MNGLLRKLGAFSLGMLFCILLLEGAIDLLGWSRRFQEVTVDPDSFVVLCVGNSMTKGDGAPEGFSYPAILERLLQQRHPDLRARVINVGVSNGNTSMLLEELPGQLARYKPRIVTFMVGDPNFWNRYGFSRYIARQKGIVAESSWLSRVADSSGVVRWLRLIGNRNSTEDRHELLEPLEWLSYIEGKSPLTGWLSTRELEKLYVKMESYFREHSEHHGVANALLSISMELRDLDRVELWLSVAERLDPDFFYVRLYQTVSKQLKEGSLSTEMKSRFQRLFDRLRKTYPGDPVYGFMTRITSGERRGSEKRPRSNCMRTRMDERFHPYSSLRSRSHALCLVSVGKELEAVKVMEAMAERNPFSLENPLAFIKSVEDSVRDPRLKLRLKELTARLAQFYEKGGSPYSFYKEQGINHWVEIELDQMRLMSEKAGARVVVQSYPPLRDRSARLVDVAFPKYVQEHGLIFSDTLSEMQAIFRESKFKEEHYSNQFGMNDHHLSAKGNERVAEILYQTLISNGLLH